MLKNILNSLYKLDNFSLSGDYSYNKSSKKGSMTEFIFETPFLILDKQPYSKRDSDQFKNVFSINKSLNKNINKIRNLYEVIHSELNLDKYNVYIPFQQHNPYLSKINTFEDFEKQAVRKICVNNKLNIKLIFKKSFIFNDINNSIIPMPIVSFKYKNNIIFEISLDIENQVFYLINKDYTVNSLSELYTAYNQISENEILSNLLIYFLKLYNIEKDFIIESESDFYTYKSYLNLLLY